MRGEAEDLEANAAARRQRLREQDPRQLVRLGPVALEEAVYYGKTCPTAGELKEFRSEEGRHSWLPGDGSHRNEA